jgi:hypothetical protein
MTEMGGVEVIGVEGQDDEPMSLLLVTHDNLVIAEEKGAADRANPDPADKEAYFLRPAAGVAETETRRLNAEQVR